MLKFLTRVYVKIYLDKDKSLEDLAIIKIFSFCVDFSFFYRVTREFVYFNYYMKPFKC